MQKLLEKFIVYGHENILSRHYSTLEFTKENYVTKKGDCILGIKSEKSCYDLSNILKKSLQSNKKFLVRLSINEFFDEFFGYGHPKLILTHLSDMVFRTSEYICDRTIMIKCTKASKDIKREIIELLRNINNKMTIEIFEIEDH